jgi:hypothetical protein
VCATHRADRRTTQRESRTLQVDLPRFGDPAADVGQPSSGRVSAPPARALLGGRDAEGGRAPPHRLDNGDGFDLVGERARRHAAEKRTGRRRRLHRSWTGYLLLRGGGPALLRRCPDAERAGDEQQRDQGDTSQRNALSRPFGLDEGATAGRSRRVRTNMLQS